MIFFPQQPDLSRPLGEQVRARETLRNGKAFGAFADEHDVSCMFHDRFRDQRNILDIAHTTDGAGAARWSMHAAGIELDNAVFVRKTAEPHGIVVGIVFWSFDDANGSV